MGKKQKVLKKESLLLQQKHSFIEKKTSKKALKP